MATDTMYLENLNQWIFDENKIVTYRFVSSALQLPVDYAKQVLFHFFQQNENLQPLYLVSGFKANENTYSVEIVKPKKLEAAKKTFSPLNSVHIYSLQQAIPSDSGLLYSADRAQIVATQKENPYLSPFFTNEWSTIQCKEGEDALLERSEARREVVPEEPPPIRKKQEASAEKAAPTSKKPANKSKSTGKSTKNQAASKPADKASLSNFFGPAKKATGTEPKEEPKADKESPKKASGAQPTRTSPRKKAEAKELEPKKSPKKAIAKKETKKETAKKETTKPPKKTAKQTKGKKASEPESMEEEISIEENFFEESSSPKVTRLRRKADRSSQDSMDGVYSDSDEDDRPVKKPVPAKPKLGPKAKEQEPKEKTKKGRKKAEPASDASAEEKPKKRGPKKAESAEGSEDPPAKKKAKKTPTKKRKREDEEKEQKDNGNQRKFLSYFQAGGGDIDPVIPKIIKTEIITVKKEDDDGYLVFSDEKRIVEDKEAQEKVLQHMRQKAKESSEPAPKKRKVEQGAVKQGSLSSFFIKK